MQQRRSPSRIPVRGAIGAVLTVGGMALLLSFRGPDAPVGDIARALTDDAGDSGANEELLVTPMPAATDPAPPETATAGGDIIKVEALALPVNDRRSLRISQGAEPVLREQAVAIDCAEVDVVSGATYTSLAYSASLQSALDQLGI